MAVGLVAIALVVSARLGHATTDIGLYDFGTGASLLDYLILNRSYNAVYTRYDPATFSSFSDFASRRVWLVPSFGTSTTYQGLRSNPTFQTGTTFSRVVIMALDPDNHFGAHQGAGTVAMNALEWAAGGPGPGIVILDDPYTLLDWLPPSWAVSRPQGGCVEDVRIAPGQAGHPVNAGLTDALLSFWQCSAHMAFPSAVSGWLTLHRFGGSSQPMTITRQFCTGPAGDCDGDGVPDGTDNCPALPNANQADGDGDGVGDVCDNCPATANPGQADSDGNGIGDACQDTDGDGVIDIVDNCPTVSNAGQADSNGNGIGDACEDRDGDGVSDADDNCVNVPNADQADADHDHVGDVCDPCTDTDRDGFGDPGFPANTCPLDNCPHRFNPDQRDTDGDGIGDVCFMCTVLGELPSYSAVIEKTLTAKLGSSIYGYIWFGTDFTSTACVGKARLRGGHVFDGDLPGNLVATTTRGTGIRFLAFKSYDFYSQNEVYGDVVTAGAAVKGTPAIYHLNGVIDTTGHHPALAPCQQAQATARTASARFAALPPTQVLGDVQVGPNQYYTIHGGPGDVIQIDTLRVSGGATNPTCSKYSYNHMAGRLYVEGDGTIVNLKKLQFNDCAVVELSGDIVFNFPGKGPAIRIGRSVYSPPILAPDRTLITTGAPDDYATEVHAWVGNAITTGFTFLDNGFDVVCEQ